MPLKPSVTQSPKKPAPAARSAGVKTKTVHKGGSKTSRPKPRASASASKKPKRHPAAFSSLKARQQAVERAKLQVWRHLQEINGAVIKLAESGSYLAARTLFEFAGVYSLPPLEETAPSALPPAPVTEPASPLAMEKPAPTVNRVEAFLQSLGLDPLSDEEPEPDVAA